MQKENEPDPALVENVRDSEYIKHKVQSSEIKVRRLDAEDENDFFAEDESFRLSKESDKEDL